MRNSSQTDWCRKSLKKSKSNYIITGLYFYSERDSYSQEIIREGFQVDGRIIIGDYVWIGMGAMILHGVTIGDGAVIVAGAVVSTSIPPHCLAAGVPARVVRTNVNWR